MNAFRGKPPTWDDIAALHQMDRADVLIAQLELKVSELEKEVHSITAEAHASKQELKSINQILDWLIEMAEMDEDDKEIKGGTQQDK